jgi:hypothetical protein
MRSLSSPASTKPNTDFVPAHDLRLDAPPPAEAIPSIDPKFRPSTILGNGALFKFGIGGGDLNKVFHFYEDQIGKAPNEAAYQIDLALLHLLMRRKEEAYRVQTAALERQQIFRVIGTAGKEVPVRRRVLALVAPGDFTNNAQLEFILDGGDVGLDVLYLVPGRPLPAVLPEHDVAFVAVNESDENLATLQRLARIVPRWPRPVLNAPEKIARLSRNGVAASLRGVPQVCAPQVARVALLDLEAVAAGTVSLDDLLPAASYPVLARPVGSHGGKGLAKVDNREALGKYLSQFSGSVKEFFIAPFIDYRGADGLFRKYRIVFFEGRPFLCHMALSDHWMIHYLNAGMSEDEAKRTKEAQAMETFDDDFARRHQAALAVISDRLGVDYLVIDCSELPDGRLLLFEADIAMVIHSMDPPAIFPYKQAHMAKVFTGFRAMIDRAAVRPPGLAQD